MKKHKKEEYRFDKIELKPCPWCGSSGLFIQEPLWQETSFATTGYYGSYCYYVKCCNPNCNAIAPNGKVVDVYIKSEEAQRRAIENWNIRGYNDETE